MAGLSEVANGQGSGLSWMGPQSTFDPISYAKDALNAKAQKDAADDQLKAAKIKQYDVKSGKQYNNDLTQYTPQSLNTLNSYITQTVRDKGGVWDFETEQEANRRAQAIGLGQQRLENQYLKGTEVRKNFESDKNTKLSYDKMNLNNLFYEKPEAFLDDPRFEKYKPGYDAILTELMSDPYYQKNPQLAQAQARIEFRDTYEGDLLGAILKEDSLPKYIKDFDDVLFNTITKEKGNGAVTIKEVSNGRGERKVTFTDGTSQIIQGTDQTAENSYNGDADLKRSVQSYYEDLPQDDRVKYEGASDPALAWWKDYVANSSGDVTTSSKVEKSGSNFLIGGQRANDDVTFTPFDRPAQYNRGKGESVTSNQRGWDIVDKNKKGITITGQHIRYYYDTKNNSQVKIPFESTGELENATVHKSPTITGIKKSQLLNELSTKTYAGQNAQDYFLQKFGKVFGYNDKDFPIEDVILGDDEIKFLQAVGLGKYIKDRKFASGKLTWYQSGIDDDKGDIKRTVNGAEIPLEDVDPDFISKTGVSMISALDDPNSGFPDIDYDITPKNTAQIKKSIPSNSKWVSGFQK